MHEVDNAEFLPAFYAGPYNSVRATLEGWRTTIRAEVAVENIHPVNPAPYSQDGHSILSSMHVHGITDARKWEQQQQAEEAERGQRLQKQLNIAASLIDVRASTGRTTNAENVQSFLRCMDKSAGVEGNDSYMVKTVLRKNEAMLTAEEELVLA